MSFGRLERTTAPKPMSEINMTPLVDVMLVLLVIFMVTAPLLGSTVSLELPGTDAARPAEAPTFVTVSVDRSGQAYLDDQPLELSQLTLRLGELARRNPNAEVQLRADQTVAYGRIVEVMGVAQKAGLNRIGFVAVAPPLGKP